MLEDTIPGMLYIPNYLTEAQQNYLLEQADGMEWSNQLSRRVQHWGYTYNYKNKSVTVADYLGELPQFLRVAADKMYSDGHVQNMPDQCIINEYHPGQGIGKHVDCEPCFDDTVSTLSLGSHTIIEFENIAIGHKKKLVLLPGSLLVITGEARYDYTHRIARKKFDTIDGVATDRGRRLSLTFRKVLLDG